MQQAPLGATNTKPTIRRKNHFTKIFLPKSIFYQNFDFGKRPRFNSHLEYLSTKTGPEVCARSDLWTLLLSTNERRPRTSAHPGHVHTIRAPSSLLGPPLKYLEVPLPLRAVLGRGPTAIGWDRPSGCCASRGSAAIGSTLQRRDDADSQALSADLLQGSCDFARL